MTVSIDRSTAIIIPAEYSVNPMLQVGGRPDDDALTLRMVALRPSYFH